MMSCRSFIDRRAFGLWLALALAILAPAAAAAPDRGEDWPEPRFPIQDLRVEGLDRASEGIVLAESRLHAGAAYSEAELRQAVYRVIRLPFVLDADFRLEKGDERGTYRLVMAVVESKRFFFNREAEYAVYASTLAERAARSREDDVLHRGTAGARFFVGRRGELFAALGIRETFQAGYNHYDLFGRGAVAGVAASKGGTCCETQLFSLGLVPDLTTWSLDEPDRLTLHLTVPLAGNRSLVAAYSTLRTDDGNGFQVVPGGPGGGVFTTVVGNDLRHDRLDLRWRRDSSDDPVFATRGGRLDAGLDLQLLHRDVEALVLRAAGPSQVVELAAPAPLESAMLRFSAGGEAHRPLGARQALTWGGRLAVGRSSAESLQRDGGVVEADLTVYEASVHAAHRVDLWHHADPQVGELWWETHAEVAWEDVSGGQRLASGAVTRSRVGISLAFRNAWGLFRFGLSINDLEGEE